MTVGMYTTVGGRCGIADYSGALTTALVASHAATVDTVAICPGAWSPRALARAGTRLSRARVVHMQHTYSFFGVDHVTYTIAMRVLRARIRRPLVITAHTVRAPGRAHYAGGLGSALANVLDAPRWHDVETFARADAVIVHARLHRERLLARGIAADRCHVIPPGVPPRVPVSPAAVARFRTRHGLEGRPVVGVFGFLERSKRFAMMLDALAETGGSGAEAPLLLLAGGPRLPEHDAVVREVRADAARAGLADRVIITGYLERDEVPVALEAMDVVAVPYATDDSVSYSLHVALAQRRPVVATDLDPMREIAERGRCVTLVRAGDPHDLAKTLRDLLEDTARRARLAAAAAEYAEVASVAVTARLTLGTYAAIGGRGA
jgi:glycosyltransferase involved in cell wall biosynthesis